MVPKPGETFNEWWGAVGQSAASRAYAEQDGRDPDAPWDEGEAFFHDVPAEVTAEAFARGELQQSDKPLGEPWPMDAWPDVPTSAIASRHDRLFPEALSVATCATGSGSSRLSSTAVTWSRWPTRKAWPRCCSTRLTETAQRSADPDDRAESFAAVRRTSRWCARSATVFGSLRYSASHHRDRAGVACERG